MALISSLFTRALTIAQDVTSVRWETPELEMWGNDGLRDIITIDPPANTVQITKVLVDGAKQTLNAADVLLLDVVGNINADSSPGKQIRMAERSSLDAAFPNWQGESKKAYVTNVMYDAKNRKVYWVYPPVTAGTKIEMVISQYASDVTSGSTFPLDAQYQNAFVDYLLYRMFSKDAEDAANAQRAAAHLSLFNNALGAIIANRTGGTPQKEN